MGLVHGQKGGKMKLINIDTVRRIIDSPRNKTQMLNMLEQTPTVEIIMCKNCKHYQLSDDRAFGFPVKRCEITGFEDVDDDDFCSRAERRQE